MTPPFESYSLANLLVYCYWYSSDIYVKAFKDGSCSLPISNLSGLELLEFIFKWDERKAYPPRQRIREYRMELPHE